MDKRILVETPILDVRCPHCTYITDLEVTYDMVEGATAEDRRLAETMAKGLLKLGMVQRAPVQPKLRQVQCEGESCGKLFMVGVKAKIEVEVELFTLTDATVRR